MSDNESILVRPHVGCDYHERKLCGLKILILGESHYCPDPVLPPDWTQERIQEIMDGCTPPAYACLAKVVALFNDGKRPDLQVRRQFWQQVAFYSFVQTKVIGDKPRKRPTVEQWEEGKRIFPAALNLLKPEFILVLGKELSDHLPGASEVAILKNEATDKIRNCNVYETPEGKALALSIYHPSFGGFAYEEWMPWLRIALERRAKDPVSTTIRQPLFQLVKMQEIHHHGSIAEHMVDENLLATLVRKGLVHVTDSGVSLTEKGIRTIQEQRL
jgi:hypothetical protein